MVEDDDADAAAAAADAEAETAGGPLVCSAESAGAGAGPDAAAARGVVPARGRARAEEVAVLLFAEEDDDCTMGGRVSVSGAAGRGDAASPELSDPWPKEDMRRGERPVATGEVGNARSVCNCWSAQATIKEGHGNLQTGVKKILGVVKRSDIRICVK